MKNLAKFSVDRAITVFMAVILVIVFGVVSYGRLSTDLFPSMNIPVSIVVTTYPGASPEEVEEIVSKPLEEVLSTTTNIERISSTSQENVSIIVLEFGSDANMDSAIIEMRENLDMVLSSFPDMVGSPMIIKINPDMMPIVQFTASSDTLDQQSLTEYVNEEVLPLIERISGVASVNMSGGYESEVRLVLDEVKIAQIDAQFIAIQAMADPTDEVEDMHFDKEFISNILMAQNFAFPVGYLNISGSNYLVRVGDDFETVADIENMILFDMSGMGGEVITLGSVLVPNDEGDVIRYINANEREYSKLNGNPAISVTIQKSSNFATTDVSKEVLALLDELGVDGEADFVVLLDQGEYIEQATGSVTDNLLYGAILAVFVLLVFLRSARATLIVALAIPISLMFAIVLIYLSGITLNIVSLGGLALGIGMLVDNSIVVMENIFRMKKKGMSNRDAAIQGTQQVSGAIIASTITTIAVFLPIIFIEGFIKEIFMQMAMTIAFSLVASLLVALTLVPAISSKILKETEDPKDDKEETHNKFKDGYKKVFNFALKYKVFVMISVVILFVLSIAFSFQNGFEYFPESDEGQLNVSIQNPVGEDAYSFEEFIVALDEFTEDVMEMDDIETVGITLGSMQSSFLGFSSSDIASASIILKDDREMTTIEINAEIHAMLIENFPRLEFEITGSQQQTGMLTGSGIQIQLEGFSLEGLQEEAEEIASLLEGIDGLIDIDSGVGRPSKELQIQVRKEDAIKYFMTNAQILGIVAEAYAQEQVVTTINEKGSLYDIYIYDSNSIDETVEYDLETVRSMKIGEDMFGNDILLSMVANVGLGDGFTSISRINGTRTVTVSASFEEGSNTTNISNEVEELLASDYEAPEGFTYDILGEQEEVMEAMNVLLLAMGLAILLIYMVMASQFQSLTYPFIIMFTIPLAFTGGFAILWLTGMTVSVVAIIGLIILVGVVVNNGIVLVDYTNQLRETGLSVKEALLEAGQTRLRPIIMTALTTILALSTMALGIGEGAEMMQPMAVTTVGGLLYATVVTLLIVPIMYYLVTKYGKQIFGFGGSILFLAGAITLIVFGMVFIGIITILIAGLTAGYTVYLLRGVDLVE